MDSCYQEHRILQRSALDLVPFWRDAESVLSVDVNAAAQYSYVTDNGDDNDVPLCKEGSSLNGIFCEKGISAMCHTVDSSQNVPEMNVAEVEWISKDRVFQELIRNERSFSWSDLKAGKPGTTRDEHELDLLSTLTAVAAMVGELCSLDPSTSLAAKDIFQANGKVNVDERGAVDSVTTEPVNTVSMTNSLQAERSFIDWSIDFAGPQSLYSTQNLTSLSHENKCAPHSALSFVFPYLELRDILRLECTCKVLKDWIRSDLPLWQELHIEPPLSNKFTDEALRNLAARTKGQLRCLTLVDCMRVSESALQEVVYLNPMISKLNLPGCSRLTPEGVLKMVTYLVNCSWPGRPVLKQLGVGNLYNLKKEQLGTLLTLLPGIKHSHGIPRKPQYYGYNHYPSLQDEARVIDAEECPKCSNVRIVYDCTSLDCQKLQGADECRGCILCIYRCEDCGKCINDSDYVETFFLDLLCTSCWLRLPKCCQCHRPVKVVDADDFIPLTEEESVCRSCYSLISNSGDSVLPAQT